MRFIRAKEEIKKRMMTPGLRRQRMVCAVVLLIALALSVIGALNTKKEIKIVIDTNENILGGPEKTQRVSAGLLSTVETVLAGESITIAEDSILVGSPKTMVKDIDEIRIIKKVLGMIKADGKEIPFFSAADTVADVLQETGVQLGPDDEVSVDLNSLISKDNNVIRVTRVSCQIEGRQQEVPFKTISQENEEMEFGTETVKQKGEKGLETLVEKVTYKDGKASEREVIAQATIFKAVDQVMEVGTKNPYGASVGNATEDIGDEMDFICAVVAQEGGQTYEGALAVISCIMNRADTGAWGGNDALSVITAPGQFSAYLDGAYQQYMGDDLPEVRRAVTDCMEQGIRSHQYLSFRSYQWTDTAVQVTGFGNWYDNPM